jgi:hypothetical protein
MITAFKNLTRNGIYSVINVVGLSVSLATVILIMLWVNDEYSFDKFHKRSKDIYLATFWFKMGDTESQFRVTPMPLAATAKANIPEIENVCNLLNDNYSIIVIPSLRRKRETPNNYHINKINH